MKVEQDCECRMDEVDIPTITNNQSSKSQRRDDRCGGLCQPSFFTIPQKMIFEFFRPPTETAPLELWKLRMWPLTTRRLSLMIWTNLISQCRAIKIKPSEEIWQWSGVGRVSVTTRTWRASLSFIHTNKRANQLERAGFRGLVSSGVQVISQTISSRIISANWGGWQIMREYTKNLSWWYGHLDLNTWSSGHVQWGGIQMAPRENVRDIMPNGKKQRALFAYLPIKVALRCWS